MPLTQSRTPHDGRDADARRPRLLVDDEPTVLAVAKRFAEAQGFEVGGLDILRAIHTLGPAAFIREGARRFELR